jgi:lysophospholipase L1-like esterase
MKSAPVISAKFWERIDKPTSRFHSDYVAYQSGEITDAELIARLPHIAMLGDSVCTNVYISSVLSTFWRARTCRGGNWFLDIDPSPTRVDSIYKKLEALTPFVATEYAGVGAMVDDERERLTFFRRILGTRNFSGQVGQLLAVRRFPDLIFISIGHNNVDWAWRCPASELEQLANRLKTQAEAFRENFTRELRRLIERARAEKHRVAIIVYGLVNFEAYFKAREEAERRRAQDSTLYPHLETTYKYFGSFRPEYRRNLIRLTTIVNGELRAMVDELNKEFVANTNMQLRYSDALATADLTRVELLHAIDGWHPSIEGHNVLAEAAFKQLGPSLEFLGIKPRLT